MVESTWRGPGTTELWSSEFRFTFPSSKCATMERSGYFFVACEGQAREKTSANIRTSRKPGHYAEA